MNKLPFVWELKYKDIASHAIGTCHWIQDIFREDIKKYLQGKSCAMNEYWDESDHRFFKEFREGDMAERIMAEKIKANPAKKAFYEARYEAKIKNFKEYAGGIDFVVEETALAMNIPIIGLEIKEERDRLNALYDKVEKNFYKATKRKWEGTGESYWCSDEKTIKKLSEKIDEDCKKHLTAEEFALHKQRNPDMAARSLQYIMRAPSIIAVGIQHFFAEPSMLTLYQQNGIEINRVE